MGWAAHMIKLSFTETVICAYTLFVEAHVAPPNIVLQFYHLK